MQASRRPQIGDVAREANVSTATVSRALRNTGRVADRTRERVLKAATDLGYVTDPHASRLRSRRNHTIGLVAPGLKWYLSRFILGVERTLHAANYDLSLIAVETPTRRSDFLDAALNFSRRVDGLLLVDLPAESDVDDRLSALDRPIVGVGMSLAGQSSITVSNRAAAAEATDHLIGLGHRRIGLLSVRDALAGEIPVTALDRTAGYQDSLRAAGIEADPRLVIENTWDASSGRLGMASLLALDDPPTAVFTVSDEIALGAWAELDVRHLRVPRDLSLVGFDDHDLSATFGLTTVTQSVDKLGERATAMLLARIDDPNEPIRSEEWPVALVRRRSSAVLSAERATSL